MARASSNKKWYHDGLAFTCRGCGECCRGPGGYVWITEDEARELAGALDMTLQAFASKFLRTTASGLALVDDTSGDCPLLGADGKCRVYHRRPLQCRTWPWWSENLISRRRWDDAAARCPGMNAGPVHSPIVIEAEAAKEF